MPDPATMQLLWWAFAALLLLCFALLDGFDVGIALLLPLVAHTDEERTSALGVVGPGWQGNPLWLLLGGGAIMLAWPMYASAFSVFYLALLLTLCALFLRPFGFALRPRVPLRWRPYWDRALCCGGLLPAVFFGLAAGNLFTGALPDPLQAEPAMPYSLLQVVVAHLHPFALYCSLLSTLLLALHGGAMLVMRTEGQVQRRSRRIVILAGLLLALLFAAGGFWLEQMHGLHMHSRLAGEQTMLWPGAGVSIDNGAWLSNYQRWPWLWLAPAASLTAALATSLAALSDRRWLVFLGSSLTLSAILITGVLALFPFVLPDSAGAHQPQALWDAAARHRLLPAGLLALAVLLPCLLAYTARAYHAVRGPVRAEREYDD